MFGSVLFGAVSPTPKFSFKPNLSHVGEFLEFFRTENPACGGIQGPRRRKTLNANFNANRRNGPNIRRSRSASLIGGIRVYIIRKRHKARMAGPQWGAIKMKAAPEISPCCRRLVFSPACLFPTWKLRKHFEGAIKAPLPYSRVLSKSFTVLTTKERRNGKLAYFLPP